jgi:putative DNA primase/helicase
MTTIDELKKRPNWVLWKHSGKHKVPYTLDGKLASTTNPDCWSTYDQCTQVEGFNGTGLVLELATGIIGIDIDHVAPNGKLLDTGARIVSELNSYTEWSPSRTGIHILLEGFLPEGCKRKVGDYEMYDRAQFLTFTGWHLEGTPETIENRQSELDSYIKTYMYWQRPPHRQCIDRQTIPANISDQEVLDKAFKAKNGQATKRLYEGDTSGYPSPSEADMSLARRLWYWTNHDQNQVKRLMKNSSLNRKKYNEPRGKKTYLEYTLDKIFGS